MADIGYDGKVAIITGAGGGLGREHALELARRGARVVVNDLGGSVSGEGGDKGPAEHVADEINDLGGEAVPDTNSVATAEGGEAVIVSHQSPIWSTRLFLEGRSFVHDPRRRQCTLASLTTLIFSGTTLVGMGYREPAGSLLAHATAIT